MNEDKNFKSISFFKSFLIFTLAGILFYIVIKLIVPWLSSMFSTTEYIIWMFAGTFLLFIPLFVTTLIFLKKDGYELKLSVIMEALNLKKIEKKDMFWVIGGLIVAGLLCGLIIIFLMIFCDSFTIDSLYSVSPISVSPLRGNEFWFVLFLPVFFFFNYVGEEILWRGYILPRQLKADYGRYAVIINALFHCIYHFVFGINPLIIMFPLMVLMPFVAAKTKNTWTSVIIHTLIGAPSQIMIVLGIIGY